MIRSSYAFSKSAVLLMGMLALPAIPIGCRTHPPAGSKAAGAEAVPPPPGPPVASAEEDPTAREAEAFSRRVAQRLAERESGRPGVRGQAGPAPPGRRAAGSGDAGEIQWNIPLRPKSKGGDAAAANQPGSIRVPGTSGERDGTASEPSAAPAPAPMPPSPGPPLEASPPSRAAPVSGAAPMAPDASTQRIARRLREKLLREARSGGEKARPWLGAMAMSLIDPRLELTAERMPDVSPERRKLLLAYQRTFTLLGRHTSAHDGEDADRLRQAARELHEQITGAEMLRIRHPRLCQQVEGYGVYTPFEDRTFLAGREHPVIVYAELENFATRPTDAERHVVRLTQEIVLYNKSDGLAVWRVDPTRITDRSRNRRRDFFSVQVVRLPAALTVGQYVLKIRVVDEIGGEVDEATIPLSIVADAALDGE